MSDANTHAERIEAVSNAEADGERLVSAAVPPEGSLEELRRTVQEDHAEAEYLDVREEVGEPLKRAIEAVKRVVNRYDETPADGLAVYAGVVGSDLVTHVFDDLPEPVASGTYGYANEFDTAPIEPSASGTDGHGLLIVAREQAMLGRYGGTDVEPIETVESDVPSKQAAAGRAEDRFRGRSEERRAAFFDAVGDAAERAFLESKPAAESGDGESRREPAVAGLLLGGSEVTVETFRDGDHLPGPLAERLDGPFAVEYVAEPGLRRLVDEAEAAGALDGTDAREALDRFLDALDGETPAVGGRADVDRALEYDAVETLLLSDSLPPTEIQPLEARAAESGADCVVVPGDLDRAERLRESFDGVGALLRFSIE